MTILQVCSRGHKIAGWILAAVALAVYTADAKTVAWYHFDEVQPGSRYTSSDTVLNAVDPTKLPGKAYSMGTYGTTAYTALGSDPNFMPTATNSVPDIVQVFDPASGAIIKSDRSLYFTYADHNTSPARFGGCVKVDSDASLSLSDLTVECFVCPKRLTDKTNNGWTLVSKETVFDNAFTYSICIYNDGKPYVNIYNSAGTVMAGYNTGFVADISLLDGNWHHVAFTVSNTTARLYVDYSAYATTTLSTPLYYVDDKPLYIGAARTVYKPGGFIDEVRISDTALDPSSFLRRVNVNAVFHAGFDGSYNADVIGSDASYGTGVADRLDDWLEYPVFTSDKPCAYFVNGEANTFKKDNGSALRLDGGIVKYPHNPDLEMKEMTVECFMKFQAASNYAGILRFNQSNNEWAATTVVWSVGFDNSGHLSMRVDNYQQQNQNKTFGSSFLDGEWHHLGITFQRLSGNLLIRVYDNYQQVGGDWSVSGGLRYTLGSCLAIGTTSSSLNPKRPFYGCVDEVRITKGVLPVRFFMHPASKPGFVIFVK